MPTRLAIRLYTFAGLLGALLLLAPPARAQFQPRPLNDPATGETYHIEGAAGFWFPTAQMTISSESLGIIGTRPIDDRLKSDLGLTDQRFPELHLELRPSKTSTSSASSTSRSSTRSPPPSRATSSSTASGTDVGLPVNSTLDWKAYRFGYEFDFVVDEPRIRGLHPRRQVHRRPRASSTARSRASSRAPGRRFRRSAASAASTSCRTSRSPAR